MQSTPLTGVRDGDLTIRPVGYDHPDAHRLIGLVQKEYVVRYGGPDESPVEVAEFLPPEGSFYVGYADGEAVATGAWRRSGVDRLGTTRTAEIKRMYVVPAAQRRGHARRMLAAVEDGVRAAGFEAVVLETGVRQPEAIALYLSSGYEAIPGFGHYAGEPLSRCFGKRL
ncbi:GNAT family N-acetyltransferase [Nocardioides insulae]|uniref:GNAT family N-acetyltransferase n=1 Tax=Nocardioides insulae TaxID=394734 RepID=UPI0004292CBA|nr:GNAT family N-acetyltransferase [Nocardioides insulae]